MWPLDTRSYLGFSGRCPLLACPLPLPAPCHCYTGGGPPPPSCSLPCPHCHSPLPCDPPATLLPPRAPQQSLPCPSHAPPLSLRYLISPGQGGCRPGGGAGLPAALAFPPSNSPNNPPAAAACGSPTVVQELLCSGAAGGRNHGLGATSGLAAALLPLSLPPTPACGPWKIGGAAIQGDQ